MMRDDGVATRMGGRMGAELSGDSEFERRTRELLTQSADALPAAVRSRLTQARYAALGAGAGRATWIATRRWAWPAGVLAAAALAVLVVVVPHREVRPTASTGGASVFEDVELLSDSEAVPLVQDASSGQGADYDFYEWAASEAGAANASGT